MALRVLVMVLLAASASASSRFEVIGVSRTHLALREFYSLSQCCGADSVVDCRYEGLTALQKQRLDVLTLPVQGVAAIPVLTGVRLHFVPWEPKALVEPGGKSSKRFDVYRSVTKRGECTPKALAAATLAEAHTYAKSVGIDLKDPVTSVSRDEPAVSATSCTAERYSPACRPEEGSSPEYFVFGQHPDTVTLLLFVRVDDRIWVERELSNNGGVWLAPRREVISDVGQVVHFRRFSHFMGEVTEWPLFLVHPRD